MRQKWHISWDANWLNVVRGYFEHELTMSYCGPAPQTNVHADLLMKSVIGVFAAAGLASRILSCPLNLVFLPIEPRHFPVLIDTASSMGEDSTQVRIPDRIKHWLFKKFAFVDYMMCYKPPSPSYHIRIHNISILEKMNASLFTVIQKTFFWNSLMKLQRVNMQITRVIRKVWQGTHNMSLPDKRKIDNSDVCYFRQ